MPREDMFEVPATIELVVQAEGVAGMSIAFTGVVTQDEIDGRLDMCRKAIARQWAQQGLIEALSDVRSTMDGLAGSPKKEAEYLRNRADERVRLAASLDAKEGLELRARADDRDRIVEGYKAGHEAHKPRVAFRPTDAQKRGLVEYDAETDKKIAAFPALREAELAKFDLETQSKKVEFETDREKARAMIPLFEARAEQSRRIIAGAERAEVIEGLKLAAE